MTVLQTLFGVGLGLVFLVKLNQVRRAATPARVTMSVYLGFLVLKAVLALRPVVHLVDGLVGPGTSKLAQNLCILAGLYTLVRFFLYVSDSVRRSRLELIPVLVAAAAMTWAVLATPAPQRPVIFESVGPDSVGAVVFAAFGDGYIVWAFVVALLGIRRYISEVGQTSRTALRIVAVGLGGAAAFGAVARLVSVVLRFFDVEFPAAVDFVIYVVASISSLLVLIGFVYPEVVGRSRRWLRERRVLIGIWPLWSRLQPAFPEIALAGSSRRGRRNLLRIGFRYDRRRIECRDALWELSPFLREPPAPASAPLDQARQVDTALADKAADAVATARPASIAPPVDDTRDADDAALLALSRALVELDSAPAVLARPAPD